MQKELQTKCGLPALDKLLGGVELGDNFVWQVEKVENGKVFVDYLVSQARLDGKRVTYFRFADHEELVAPGEDVSVVEMFPEHGFERFITGIHREIEALPTGSYFVFDLLSYLTEDNFSERMLGNLCSLTFPLLSLMEDLAYFFVLKNHHSYHANRPINETAQIIINVFDHEDKLHLHVKKVVGRHSSVMHMVHTMVGDALVPVNSSFGTTNILGSQNWAGLQSASYRMIGKWDLTFMRLEDIFEAYKQGELSESTLRKYFERVLPKIISTDEKILELAREFLTIEDILFIWKRTVGSGMIGGKAAGMLLARAIIRKRLPHVHDRLEPHDSFFIASDVFYLFLVQNNCWDIRQQQKNEETAFDYDDEVRDRIMNGEFPDYLLKRFNDMLDYYGQSPIIVRSSSLLEDNYGNAFAGKYDSVFCPNQGRREKRFEEFMDAVKIVYASTMTKSALAYRVKRGILERDEQMSLLVQRVSGSEYEHLFFPDIAGVGLSFNPYVWDRNIDPQAGVLRLVFGLGTRAVNRSDDDHTRIVALNCPENQPTHGIDSVRKSAQKRMDLINLRKRKFTTEYFVDVVRDCPRIPVHVFANMDPSMRGRVSTAPGTLKPWILDFRRAFNNTTLIDDMKSILKELRDAYGTEVEIEYTANYREDESFRINLVQCRPFQVEVDAMLVEEFPADREPQTLLAAKGSILGHSRKHGVDRIIYVVPATYSQLSEKDRYMVARIIGNLNDLPESESVRSTMLIGPGRWGTSTPSLGVPISPMDINSVTVMCEMDVMHEGLTPDLSLGTHFFHELVESNILYIGYFAKNEGNSIDLRFLERSKNRLTDLVPDKRQWAHVVRVIDSSDVGTMYLASDLMTQTANLFI